VVVDNSSAFRMDDDVPLVVPEIQCADVKKHKGIIANPNAPRPSHLCAVSAAPGIRVKRILPLYQAVSGTGAKAIEELKRQWRNRCRQAVTKEVYPHQSPSMCCRMWIHFCRRVTPRKK